MAPAAAPPLDIDPSAPGTIVRATMAAEACFSFFLAYGMLVEPRATTAQLFLSDDPAAGSPAAVSSLLMEWIGVWTLATNVPLLVVLPNRTGAIERRQVAYAVLSAMEVLWVPILACKAWRWDGEGGLFWGKIIGGIAEPMTDFLVFGLLVLCMWPGWMTRYRVRRDGIDQKIE